MVADTTGGVALGYWADNNEVHCLGLCSSGCIQPPHAAALAPPSLVCNCAVGQTCSRCCSSSSPCWNCLVPQIWVWFNYYYCSGGQPVFYCLILPSWKSFSTFCSCILLASFICQLVLNKSCTLRWMLFSFRRVWLRAFVIQSLLLENTFTDFLRNYHLLEKGDVLSELLPWVKSKQPLWKNILNIEFWCFVFLGFFVFEISCFYVAFFLLTSFIAGRSSRSRQNENTFASTKH